MAECKHKYVYSRSDSYWMSEGRYSRCYYHVDYFYCEKCLTEKVIEKRHSCYESEIWDLPDWARLITKKVGGYE